MGWSHSKACGLQGAASGLNLVQREAWRCRAGTPCTPCHITKLCPTAECQQWNFRPRHSGWGLASGTIPPPLKWESSNKAPLFWPCSPPPPHGRAIPWVPQCLWDTAAPLRGGHSAVPWQHRLHGGRHFPATAAVPENEPGHQRGWVLGRPGGTPWPPALPRGCVCRVPACDSTYLCHTLATQLLGMRHSLPDTLDATNHHSPSLQGRGQDVLWLLGARKGLPVATGMGAGTAGWRCPLTVGTYSARTWSCSPILRTVGASEPEGKSHRASARKLFGAVGNIMGLSAREDCARQGVLGAAEHSPGCVGSGDGVGTAAAIGMLNGFSRLGRLPILCCTCGGQRVPPATTRGHDWLQGKERVGLALATPVGRGTGPPAAMCPMAQPCRDLGLRGMATHPGAGQCHRVHRHHGALDWG